MPVSFVPGIVMIGIDGIGMISSVCLVAGNIVLYILGCMSLISSFLIDGIKIFLCCIVCSAVFCCALFCVDQPVLMSTVRAIAPAIILFIFFSSYSTFLFYVLSIQLQTLFQYLHHILTG